MDGFPLALPAILSDGGSCKRSVTNVRGGEEVQRDSARPGASELRLLGRRRILEGLIDLLEGGVQVVTS